ncbi:hypothetical protein QN360_13365 [Glaciimonas sp. CA11.2]|nr:MULTISPECIES: hypothetical protein [unclassified Glaciimonas]MDY7544897.1 hypothetical protein [Glaciimonas sp. CA11.2]MEB0014114.1 hypothetical protein [Glaciimonas sp. Cout2]MEB0083493.1 hypothetical protein [Glaciimonas sp. Gout2]MEB0163893.1 hypothetical protein [Glaciimonas sp. CA11.2]
MTNKAVNLFIPFRILKGLFRMGRLPHWGGKLNAGITPRLMKLQHLSEQ